jgi:hypothetical protein
MTRASGLGPRASASIAGVVIAIAACTSHADPPHDDARVAAWRDDLHALATELPAHHANAFFHANAVAWRRAVDDLDRRIPQLDDAHVIAELSRLVAAIGDGHTVLGGAPVAAYPLVLAWFDDGVFVIGAAPDAAWAVGRKVVAIDKHWIGDAIGMMSPHVSRDNEAGLYGQLPDYFTNATMLAGTDLAASAAHATYTLAAGDGTTRDLALAPGPEPTITFPKPLPLHLQGPATKYWNKYDAANKLLYFAYNECAQDKRVGPFAEFVASTLAFADAHPVDRFVIDLRRNGGGDSSIIAPLVAGLAQRPALAGRVFAIIGMHTFSSAMLNAIQLKRDLHARLVGGPTAGNPSGYGEVKRFTLPHSKLWVQYSTKLFSNPGFGRDAVDPDLPVHVTSADWFAGRDPALDAVLAAPAPK